MARSGRCEEARTILARLLARGATAIPPEGGWYATVTALGDAAHVINDTMFAQDLAEAIEPYAGRYAVQSAAASVPIDVIRAELALTLNEPACSAAIAASAAKHAELQQAIIFKARALVIEAAAHHRTGHNDVAKAALRAALPIAEQTGARLITLDAQRLNLM